MKRKKTGCVCRCTPQEGIVYMETRLLNQTVAAERQRIDHMPNPRRAASRALNLGDICAASGHVAMAVDVWRDAWFAVQQEDYEWVYTPINTRLFRFDNLVSKDEACELGRRIDRTLKAAGLRHLAHYAQGARNYYRDLWLEKYYEALP